MLNNGELYFLNHASLLFRYKNSYYWTDPWVISPAFGSWLQDPTLSASAFQFIDSLKREDLYIVISHGHDDHCDDFILKSKFADANYIIPSYRTKGFLRRVQSIATRDVIQIGRDPIQVGELRISSYINPEFTTHDAVLLFLLETGPSLIHANDNWHSQPDDFFIWLQEMVQGQLTHYFCQIGIADCFPHNYPQFTPTEYQQIAQERISRFLSTVQENGRQMGVEILYAYANQSTIVYNISRDRISNMDLIASCHAHTPHLTLNQPTVIQMLPGYRLDLLTGDLETSRSEPGAETYLEWMLSLLESESILYVKTYLSDRGVQIDFDLTFVSSSQSIEPLPKNTPDSRHEVEVYLVASPLIWSRILCAEITLEALIIGGSGTIYRYPKDYNISLIHRALSEFSYIAQSRLKQGCLGDPKRSIKRPKQQDVRDQAGVEQFTLRDHRTQAPQDHQYRQRMEAHFNSSSGTLNDKLNTFPRFVSRQALSLFLAKQEIFQQILTIHGSIIEAGVFMGAGLFTWGQLSAIYEPINYNRKIIGFDTFEGFSQISDQDQTENNPHLQPGAYRFEHHQELLDAAEIHSLTRPIGHIPKVELVQGDALQTIPQYLKDNPHLVVALLYLDFDLYEPTLQALKSFLPRMPKGAVLAFDELNQKQWPGETLAVIEACGLHTLKIERLSYTPSISFAVL